jgi:hypothetical protein
MSVEAGMEWIDTPLETDEVDPHGIEEIAVEFDEGEEILTPRLNERFGRGRAGRKPGARRLCRTEAN